MNEFLNEVARLWWVEVGTKLQNPLSEESLNGLRKILKEEYDFDSEVIEYIIESAVKTPTNFHLGGNRESGMQVGSNDTAVSAHLHHDGEDDEDGAIEYDEPIEEEEEKDEEETSTDKKRPDSGDDKEKSVKDISKGSLTAKEKEKLEENWWSDMTASQQQQYIQDHPKSQKAQDAKEKDKDKSDDKSDDEPNTSNDRAGFDEKDKTHLDNPNGPTRKEILNDLNNGNLDVLDEYQKGVQSNREKGIAGAGGAIASEGESKYCDATNTDFDKWNETNKEAVAEKQKEFDRKKTADEFRTARALGLDPKSDEFNNYLAKREVWGQQQLEKVKSDKNSVFYKKGKKGFNGKDEPYKEWMNAAYDGAQSTKQAIKESPIDTSKPNRTIQSTAEVDQAVEAHLEDSVKNSKSTEDKKHAETQLKNFKKFKGYHDTYVVGKDENGRTTYMGISNKKDDQIRDPQNNTTPKKRFKELEKQYGKEVAEGVTKSLEKSVQAVSEVKENTVKAASDIEINDDYVAICDTKEMKPYLQKLRDNGKFRDYVKAKGMNPDKMNTKELLEEMNSHSKELVSAGKSPSYEPYGKISIKVGEFAGNGKFKRENPNLNFDNESIKSAKNIKDTEKNVVKASHTSVVNDLVEADRPDGYSEDKPDADNGPHQQGYIGGVLDACHIDTYIDMGSDDGMLLQMGINGVKPSMIRNCVAERSGFKGDSSTSEGRKALKEHLRKRCRVTPGGDRITITDNGKEVELFEDTWRTAGTSQKVASGFGKGMRNCLQGKAAK